MTDNRALWELVEKLPRWDLEWEWMAECDDGDYIKRADVLAILERPVVVGDVPPVTHTVEEVMEFADLLDKHYGAFMQKPIQMLLNYAALIGTQGLTQANESMVRGKS